MGWNVGCIFRIRGQIPQVCWRTAYEHLCQQEGGGLTMDEFMSRAAAQDYRAWVKEYLGEEVTG